MPPGYINESNPRCGYYFSFALTLLGAALLHLAGWPDPDSGNITGDCDNCACGSLDGPGPLGPLGSLGPLGALGPLPLSVGGPPVSAVAAGPLHHYHHPYGHPGMFPSPCLPGLPCHQYSHPHHVCDLPPGNLPLRATRSVPEGLYRPPGRHVTVVEQITTSV